MTQELALPGSASEIGLELPHGIAFGDWAEIGSNLGVLARANQWMIGDWLNYGERAYGEKYTEAIEVTRYELATLENLAWVAGHVEPSRRREVLSWSHHSEIAQLGPADQDRWLDSAEANGWSKAQLRKQIKGVPPERECCPTCGRPIPKTGGE